MSHKNLYIMLTIAILLLIGAVLMPNLNQPQPQNSNLNNNNSNITNTITSEPVSNSKTNSSEKSVKTTTAATPKIQLNPEDITELQIQTLSPGTGEQSTQTGNQLTVEYTGYLLDGTVFDSNVNTDKPFIFTLGLGQVIAGWDLGLFGMKVGETRQLIIPAQLAYGEQGAGNIIPPNTPLIFEVKLLSIN